MTIVANVLSRIDERTNEIDALRERFNVSEYPERNDLRIELRRLMVDRGRLRGVRDEFKHHEKLLADSVALGKIITLIDEFKATKTKTHSQVAFYTLVWAISDIIDECGD